MKEKLFVNLSEKLQYSKDGRSDNFTATLEFTPPTPKNIKAFAIFAKIIGSAIMDIQLKVRNTTQEKQSDAKIEPVTLTEEETKAAGVQMIKTCLFSSVNAETDILIDNFRKIALQTCTMDGQTKITDTLLDSLSVEDFWNCICEYCHFFVTPSLL